MTYVDGRPTIEIIYRDAERTMRVVVPVLDGAKAIERLEALGAQSQPVHAMLSDREKQVARCVRMGWSNRRIAHELGISECTVKRHVSNILAKSGYESRTQLALALFA